MGTIQDKLKKVETTKEAIRTAIVSKGQTLSTSAKFSDYPAKIKAISTGVDTSNATATASDILSGKTAYVKGSLISGTIAKRTSTNVTISGAAVTIPAGYYASSVTKTIATAGTISGTLGVTGGANWSTSDSNRGSGTVTITNVSQTAGYTAGYGGGSTDKITVTVPGNRLLKGRTITPGTSSITVGAAEDILYGAISVVGEPNLLPWNIVNGVSIFGVIGSYVGAPATPTTSNVRIQNGTGVQIIVDHMDPNNGMVFSNMIEPGAFDDIIVPVNSTMYIGSNEQTVSNGQNFWANGTGFVNQDLICLYNNFSMRQFYMLRIAPTDPVIDVWMITR